MARGALNKEIKILSQYWRDFILKIQISTFLENLSDVDILGLCPCKSTWLEVSAGCGFYRGLQPPHPVCACDWLPTLTRP